MCIAYPAAGQPAEAAGNPAQQLVNNITAIYYALAAACGCGYTGELSGLW